jgi:hypothetical protein
MIGDNNPVQYCEVSDEGIVLTLLRTFRAFTPYLKNVLPVPVFILSRSTDSITYRSSYGMLPEKRGDGFRRRGYSSHFYANYPKYLTEVRMKTISKKGLLISIWE